MRVSTIGKLAVLAGVGMMAWSGIALLASVGGVGVAGNQNPGPGLEFAAEHLFVPGFLVFFVGLCSWLGGGQAKASFSLPENKGFSVTEHIKRNQESSSTKE